MLHQPEYLSDYSYNWPVTNDLVENERWSGGIDQEVSRHLILPDNGLYPIMSRVLAMGGRFGAVAMEGDPGAGKTRFGNIVMGGAFRAEPQADEVEATMFGHISETGILIPGKSPMHDPKRPIFYWNEYSQVQNGRFFNRWFDDDRVAYLQTIYDTGNAAIFMTTNHVDPRNGVNEIDSALDDRTALKAVTADVPRDIAGKIQGKNNIETSMSDNHLGMLPNGDAARKFRIAAAMAMPPSTEFGPYIVDVIEALNDARVIDSKGREEQIFARISPTAGRIGEGMQQVTRARRLWEGRPVGDMTPEDAARVAALSMPSVVRFTRAGERSLARSLGVATVDPRTRAIAMRRVISTAAFQAAVKQRDFPTADQDQKRHEFRSNYSYAALNERADAVDGFAERIIMGGPARETTRTRKSRGRGRIRSYR